MTLDIDTAWPVPVAPGPTPQPGPAGAASAGLAGKPASRCRLDLARLGRLASLALEGRTRARPALDSALYRFVHARATQGQGPVLLRRWLRALICAEVSALLAWAPSLRGPLVHAALSQGWAGQGRVADAPWASGPGCGCRRWACGRAELDALRLRQDGVDDRRWLAISRRWPHRCQDALPLDRLSAAEQAARLLRRVDQFLSLIGRAVAGQALTVAAAARRACLGHDGVADELGAALLQAVGIYPAGSLVRLHNGEACVVVRRGARANLPLVAALLDRMGLPWPTPPLRDTAMARFALQGSLPTGQLRLKPPCRPPLPSGCH